MTIYCLAVRFALRRPLQPGLTAAFDAIAGVTQQVAAMRSTPVLTLGVGPSFAVRWLIPRLASFYRQHPDIEVRLATGGAINPFKDDWTCGILLGNGDWPGHQAEPMFSADLFPVCARAIAQRLKKPADLAKEVLLEVQHSPEEWPLWLAAARVKLRTNTPGPRFDSYAMALQAAVDGVGIAIGLRPYVEDDLASGRLVAPFKLVEDVRVLIKTANSRLWGTPEFHADYIGITESGAKHLVEQGVKVVGVDYLSVEAFRTPGAPAHHILLGAGTIVIEGLNLRDVDPGVYDMYCLPLPIVGCDGAPARVVLRRS